MSTPAPVPAPAAPAYSSEADASRKEIIYYSLGSLEGGLSGYFFNSLSTLMIVALGMNPVLLGLILAIRTFWDGFVDPFIAQMSDKTRTRWGRRRPYIFVGGFGRLALLVGIYLLFPQNGPIKSNADFKSEQAAHQQAAQAAAAVPPAPPAAEASVAASVETPPPEAKPAAPVIKKPKPGMIESIRLGIVAFGSDENAYHRQVAIYLLVACLLVATIGSLSDTAYYALGIELCPSYDGRTRIVTYRSIVQKAASLINPWILPFCFLPIFTNIIQGLTWYALACCVISGPLLWLMLKNSRERVVITSAKSGPSFFKSIWLTTRNVHFLKILFLYVFIGLTNGIFVQLGTFLTIYWVFQGDALAGTTLSGYASTLATVLAFIALPAVNWACRRLQKHRALRFALIWMSVGTALKWILVDPAYPYLQLILPFFFSIGISSVYTILPSLMADVTDIDELQTGARREGMFGAVMSFMTKLLGTLQPLIAGTVLVLAGFDVGLGAHQTPETILNMRLMFSIVPAGLLLFALVALWRYPLTREYMAEVKATLIARRAQAAAGSPAV